MLAHDAVPEDEELSILRSVYDSMFGWRPRAGDYRSPVILEHRGLIFWDYHWITRKYWLTDKGKRRLKELLGRQRDGADHE